MLTLTQETQILLAIEPVNFRGQIDYLIALCEQRLSQETRSGKWFVFINRARTMVRILCYDNNGYWLATKRLSRGRYSLWPKDMTQPCGSLLAHDLSKLLKTCIVSERKKR